MTALISPVRLASYRRDTTSVAEAVRLYEWNLRASASVLVITGLVEVVTRNALDRELVAWADRRPPRADWFDVVPLDRQGSGDLAKARHRATRAGRREEVHGRVVAELTFGFWRYLVESRYHASLWVPALHRAFACGPSDLRVRRAEVARRFQQLHFVRNRAAHHEPIHSRDLARDHRMALELLRWVSPHAGTWADEVSDLPAVIAARP
ncbi:hypothetical protein [Curtobacterium sp. Leaf183]|uniref:hypothetical protein n=1 Tax=Curtobacterium sp. Leaf183 TaxID=1736291 RepID=UPI00138F8177|nr:hypothetical protein [Curtobacterium sp. Leaf183]